MVAFTALFTTAMNFSGPQRFLLMLPLCLSIAVVYKSIRVRDVREIPKAVAILWGTIVGGMSLVGFAAWFLFDLMV